VKQSVSSVYIGVSEDAICTDTWQVQIAINGKPTCVAFRSTAVEAAEAYDAYVIEKDLNLMLNFPEKVGASSSSSSSSSAAMAVGGDDSPSKEEVAGAKKRKRRAVESSSEALRGNRRRVSSRSRGIFLLCIRMTCFFALFWSEILFLFTF